MGAKILIHKQGIFATPKDKDLLWENRPFGKELNAFTGGQHWTTSYSSQSLEVRLSRVFLHDGDDALLYFAEHTKLISPPSSYWWDDPASWTAHAFDSLSEVPKKIGPKLNDESRAIRGNLSPPLGASMLSSSFKAYTLKCSQPLHLLVILYARDRYDVLSACQESLPHNIFMSCFAAPQPPLLEHYHRLYPPSDTKLHRIGHPSVSVVT
ncbi:hypothetical protein EV368DRAFT_81412 [Lentinula lateritia]|nr:hypothetical protein EV368DRAFT_81412 [Lentinula lateritia]